MLPYPMGFPRLKTGLRPFPQQWPSSSYAMACFGLSSELFHHIYNSSGISIFIKQLKSPSFIPKQAKEVWFQQFLRKETFTCPEDIRCSWAFLQTTVCNSADCQCMLFVQNCTPSNVESVPQMFLPCFYSRILRVSYFSFCTYSFQIFWKKYSTIPLLLYDLIISQLIYNPMPN